MKKPVLLLEVLRDPSLTKKLALSDWELLITQARRTNLLASLAYRLEMAPSWPYVPQRPRFHLESAMLVADRQAHAMRWEIGRLRAALPAVLPLILLKGAAYLAARLPLARGRLFSDVDILVRREWLDQAESALLIHGWQGTHHDAYDQRYYRQWMHEIPPLRHVTRGTVIDIHHSFVPETARIKTKPHLLFDELVPLTDLPGVFVLSPADLVLHSATHLFQEGEFDNGLRDLLDLDSLCRHYGDADGFWSRLLVRADQLGLQRFLFHALRYCQKLLATPVPDSVIADMANRPARPSRVSQTCLDFCYLRVFRPDHSSCRMQGTGLARAALYLRSHWLKMPLPLLLYHLTYKTLQRWRENEARTETA